MVDSVGGSSGGGAGAGAGGAAGAGRGDAGASKGATDASKGATDASKGPADAGASKGASAVGATRDVGATPASRDAADLEAAVDAETPHAEAAALEGDSFDRGVAAKPDAQPAAKVDAQPAAKVDAQPAAKVDAAPTEITPAAMAAYDAVDAKVRSLDWSRSPELADATAAEARAAIAGLPADQQAEARAALMGPVDDFARNGLVDPATGQVSADRVRAVGAFADMVGQPTVNALGDQLRSTAEAQNLPGRDAIAQTLDRIGRTNQDVSVQTSAARTLLAGPVEVVRDAMAGKIDGLSVESMAHLSRTRGDVDSDQRLRGVAEGMDPAVMGRLEAYGVRHEDRPTGTPEIVHTFLDVAGLVPGFGEPADLLNAELYREEGRYADAAISAAGAITGWGAIGTVGRLMGKGAREVGDVGTAARLAGEAREIAAEEALRARGLDARRWNQEINGTDIDVLLSTPQGRFGVLVGGDAKALRNGALDEGVVADSLAAFRRADEALRDVDGVFRADGMGALMAFPRGTDPRVLDRFIQELGASRVLLF